MRFHQRSIIHCINHKWIRGDIRPNMLWITILLSSSTVSKRELGILQKQKRGSANSAEARLLIYATELPYCTWRGTHVAFHSGSVLHGNHHDVVADSRPNFRFDWSRLCGPTARVAQIKNPSKKRTKVVARHDVPITSPTFGAQGDLFAISQNGDIYRYYGNTEYVVTDTYCCGPILSCCALPPLRFSVRVPLEQPVLRVKSPFDAKLKGSTRNSPWNPGEIPPDSPWAWYSTPQGLLSSAMPHTRPYSGTA